MIQYANENWVNYDRDGLCKWALLQPVPLHHYNCLLWQLCSSKSRVTHAKNDGHVTLNTISERWRWTHKSAEGHLQPRWRHGAHSGLHDVADAAIFCITICFSRARCWIDSFYLICRVSSSHLHSLQTQCIPHRLDLGLAYTTTAAACVITSTVLFGDLHSWLIILPWIYITIKRHY